MAYLLRTLNIIMLLGILLTTLLGKDLIDIPYGHIQIAIPAFLLAMFVQAFVMFYFIGTARMVDNIVIILNRKTSLNELFDNPPKDLAPYLKKMDQYQYKTKLGKSKVIPWTMLILVLGTLAFLMGGAFDTNLVSREVHEGIAYGFIAAVLIGFVKQWEYLGKNHKLLREVKLLFNIPDASM